MKNILATIALAVILIAANRASAETPWLGVVVADGALKQQIEATPIELRPNRPFHFYGNTVRRRYYRGVGVPLPRDIFWTFGSFFVNRPAGNDDSMPVYSQPFYSQPAFTDQSMLNVEEPTCGVEADYQVAQQVEALSVCVPVELRLASAENDSMRTAYDLFNVVSEEVQ